jgi:hypothetical protein
MHQRDSGAGSVPNTLQQQDGPATSRAAARAVQFAPLFDEGAIKLTARAVCLIDNGNHYRIELCAPTLRLPAAVPDIA